VKSARSKHRTGAPGQATEFLITERMDEQIASGMRLENRLMRLFGCRGVAKRMGVHGRPVDGWKLGPPERSNGPAKQLSSSTTTTRPSITRAYFQHLSQIIEKLYSTSLSRHILERAHTATSPCTTLTTTNPSIQLRRALQAAQSSHSHIVCRPALSTDS
jgi:hypothetical protein